MANAFNPRTGEAEAGGSLSSRPAWATQRNPVLERKKKKKRKEKKRKEKKRKGETHKQLPMKNPIKKKNPNLIIWNSPNDHTALTSKITRPRPLIPSPFTKLWARNC